MTFQMRRFASMDDNDSKNDDSNYPMYPERQGYTTTGYVTPAPPKPRESTSSYYYTPGGQALSPTHSSRTLPQPPRSLPMTPGTNPPPPQRMSFIPSKPFNNFLSTPEQASPLSTSAPATMSSAQGRPTYSATSPSASSSHNGGTVFRPQQHQPQQQQQQQQQQNSSQRQSYSHAPLRRAPSTNNGPPPGTYF